LQRIYIYKIPYAHIKQFLPYINASNDALVEFHGALNTVAVSLYKVTFFFIYITFIDYFNFSFPSSRLLMISDF
jgi:hypothetical protein